MELHKAPERMIDMPEIGKLYPPLELCVDARAVYDALDASDACEPAECSLKLHLISVRDRMSHGLIRRLHWVDTRDMLADGLTKGGIDRALLHSVSNDCKYEAKHESHSCTKVSSATKSPVDPDVGSEQRNVRPDSAVGFEQHIVQPDSAVDTKIDEELEGA